MSGRNTFLAAIPINQRVIGLLLGQDMGVLREVRWRIGPVCFCAFNGVFSLVYNTYFLTASAIISLGGTRQHLGFFYAIGSLNLSLWWQ